MTLPVSRASDADLATVQALLGGDERVFERLVEAHHAALVRLAAQYVGRAGAAEEVVQEAWLAFLQSLPRFEGRSRLKTWLFRTLINCARNKRRKEAHSIPFSALFDADKPEPENAEDVRGARGQSESRRSFGEDGEARLLRGELSQQLAAAVEKLPAAQREVLSLRDIEGFDAEEVCETLGISDANQRVLLHRARAKVRASIAAYLHDGSEPD